MTLTEQWKEGKLKFGKSYWCSDDEGNIAKFVSICEDCFFDWVLGSDVTKDVKEVLAPVPSFDEWKRLQEQLKEANEVIKWYAQPDTGSAKDYLEKWGVK